MCWRSNVMVAILLLVTLISEAANPGRVFNIKNFGATPDGATDSTEALFDAWKEACAWDGKARVFIPAGTFFVGAATLEGPCKSPIVFQVQGVVKAPTDLSKFPSDVWIEFREINGLLITGGGTFDGQGASAWPHNKCKNAECKPLPTSLRFVSVTNATIREITSVNSKFFHININGSKKINFKMIKILAADDSPNTDGIHIGDSTEVTITHSMISTGDDCISIGPGSSDINISNTVCGPGHGISVGSLGKFPNEEDVFDVHVRNCTLTRTDNGLSIKTWENSPPSSAHGFTFQDIVMHDVNNPIIIDQQYCPYTSCDKQSPSRVKISDIVYKNIRGTSSSQVAVSLLCSKSVPCQNVQLNNIELKYNKQGTVSTALCSNAHGVSSGIQIPPSCI